MTPGTVGFGPDTVRFVLLLLVASLGLMGCGEASPAVLVVEHMTQGAEEAGLLAALGTAFAKCENVQIRWVAQVPASTGSETKPDVVLRQVQRSQVPDAEAERIVWVERLLVVGPPKKQASYGEGNYLGEMQSRGVLGGLRPLRKVNAAALLSNLRVTSCLFVSRGDDSLVHRIERTLWGEEPREASKYYVETGAGMTATLQKASDAAIEERAYTLTDEVTFLRLQRELELRGVLGADPALEIATTAVANDDAGKAARATRFVKWLQSAEAKAIIQTFTVSGARPFRASSEPKAWPRRGRLDPQPVNEDDEESEVSR